LEGAEIIDYVYDRSCGNYFGGIVLEFGGIIENLAE
jgi:hypothetical protein